MQQMSQIIRRPKSGLAAGLPAMIPDSVNPTGNAEYKKIAPVSFCKRRKRSNFRGTTLFGIIYPLSGSAFSGESASLVTARNPSEPTRLRVSIRLLEGQYISPSALPRTVRQLSETSWKDFSLSLYLMMKLLSEYRTAPDLSSPCLFKNSLLCDISYACILGNKYLIFLHKGVIPL